MKRWIFVGGGLFVVTSLLLIWLYLLLFGAPKNGEEIFANLGIGGVSTDRPITESIPNGNNAGQTNQPVVNVQQSALRQLTTRPVAGFIGIDNHVYYAERGTGYIFRINVYTGEENQLTQETWPRTARVLFAPDLSSAVFTTYEYDRIVNVIAPLQLDPKVKSAEFNNLALPPQADNIAYQDSQVVLYTMSDENGTIGYAYDILSRIRTELFVLTPRQLHMVWGNGLNKIYTYTRPAHQLEGYAYEVHNNQLIPTSIKGNGLSMLANNTTQVHTYVRGTTLTSLISTTDNEGMVTELRMIPEKCTFRDTTSGILWCAEPKERITNDWLTKWYKGTIVSNDRLWSVNPETPSINLVLDFEERSGRNIDVMDMSMGAEGLFLYFRNRIDTTLWMYDPLLDT